MAVVKYKQKRKIHMDRITFEFLRCIRGFSDKEVSAIAKVHPNTIYRLRYNYTRYPSMPTILKVFKAFNYRILFEKIESVESTSDGFKVPIVMVKKKPILRKRKKA